MNILQRVCSAIVTLGPLGYVAAPGTCATVIVAPFALWLVSDAQSMQWLILFIFVATCFSLALVRYALPFFENNDPSEIVLDELIGCLFLFFNLPSNIWVLVSGVLLFRIIDIVKLFGIKQVEKLDGAWGIVLDDVCAGLVSNLLLRIVLLII